MIPKLEHIDWMNFCKKELELKRTYSLAFTNFTGDKDRNIMAGETEIDKFDDRYHIINLHYKYFNNFNVIKKTILHELIHKKQDRWGYFIANINTDLFEKQTLEWEKILYKTINKKWREQGGK